MDPFINLRLTRKNIDRFHIRSKIHEFVLSNIGSMQGKILDVGCGRMPYKNLIISNLNVKNYIGLDIESAIDYGGKKPDIFWSDDKIPLPNNEMDCAFATEVLEHCPEPKQVLMEINRVLKPQGFFFGTVPFLWPLHEVPHDAYRYTPFSLVRLLEETGFENIIIKAHGGWNAALAQMLGLYIKRGIKSKIIAFMLSIICYPIVYILLKTDKVNNNFSESSMHTGFSIVAFKK